MIHSPWCSVNPRSSRMKDGKYTKRYPRQLLHDIKASEDGYQLCRRRSPEDSGIKPKINMKIGNSNEELENDNKWVVSYCSLLSRIFQRHINVEYCHSIKSIKYILKYESIRVVNRQYLPLQMTEQQLMKLNGIINS